MKRATSRIWTRAETAKTIKALKEADYDVRKSDGKIEVYPDKDELLPVLVAIKHGNGWLIRYDAALFDESLLEDEK